MFVDKSPKSSEDKLKSWKLDLYEESSEEEISEVCLKAQTQTISMQLKLHSTGIYIYIYIHTLVLCNLSCILIIVCMKRH